MKQKLILLCCCCSALVFGQIPGTPYVPYVLPTCGAYLDAGHTQYKQFLCRNLGAAGDLYSGGLTYDPADNGDTYQWGRPTDGHEKRTSATTTILATSNTPGHASFIRPLSGLYDWRSGGGNDTRWTDATKAANDPCPAGYKVPSQAQWAAVLANNTTGTWATGYMFGDRLFLPASGVRQNTGDIVNVGLRGDYWSSTANGTNANELILINGLCWQSSGGARASGLSIRCIAQ